MVIARRILDFLNMGVVSLLVTLCLFVYEVIRSKRETIRTQRSDIKDAIRSQGIDRISRMLFHAMKRPCAGGEHTDLEAISKGEIEELLDFCNLWCEKLDAGLVCKEAFSDLAGIIRSALSNDAVRSFIFDICTKRDNDINVPWEALLRFGARGGSRLFSEFCTECLSSLSSKSEMPVELRPNEVSDSDALDIVAFENYLANVRHLKVGSVQSVVSMIRSAARNSNLNLNAVLKRNDGIECVIEELVRNVNPSAKTRANYKHAIGCYAAMLRNNR